MDRFIDSNIAVGQGSPNHLKSSLDRFIGIIAMIVAINFDYLKSSLDRFIDIDYDISMSSEPI